MVKITQKSGVKNTPFSGGKISTKSMAKITQKMYEKMVVFLHRGEGGGVRLWRTILGIESFLEKVAQKY